VNRRLAALRKFFGWAKATGRIAEEPTIAVKGIEGSPRAPKALEQRELGKLMHGVERHGSKRDQAILFTLRHAGLRVSELCALRLGDVELGDRKGSATVRSGKGSKYRTVPVSVDARRAITAYLEVRPAVTDDHLFIGQRRDGLRSAAVEDRVRKYARLAGLEDVMPHTLRHSFGDPEHADELLQREAVYGPDGAHLVDPLGSPQRSGRGGFGTRLSDVSLWPAFAPLQPAETACCPAPCDGPRQSAHWYDIYARPLCETVLTVADAVQSRPGDSRFGSAGPDTAA
jgi:integrase